MFPGGKGSRCVGLTTLPPSSADCLEIWETQLPGTLRAFQACNGISFYSFKTSNATHTCLIFVFWTLRVKHKRQVTSQPFEARRGHFPTYHHHHHHVQEGLGLIPVPCILKMKLVPPSLPLSSYVSSSFWFIL